MVTKIIIPCIIILVIFLYVTKNPIEKFSSKGTIELGFSPKDSIFMVSNNIKFVEQSVEGTKFFKTKNLIYSNNEIYSESGKFTGFIFNIKPDQRLKIGFSDLEKDKNDEISHCFDIIDNGVFQIVEKVDNTEQYAIQDIDYCLSGDMDICLSTKNKYEFNPNTDLLSIIFNEGYANYLVIKRNENGEYGSMLIHKGKNKTKFPYRLKAISKDAFCLLPTLLWTKHTFVYDSPVYWSVETQFKNDYDNAVLDMVPMESQIITETPAPTFMEDDSIDFGDAFGGGVRKILITDVGVDRQFYELDFRHNLDELYLRLNKNRIFLKLYLDEDTYIFRKFPTLESIKLFKNQQNISAIEIIIGDVVSHKYLLDESNITIISPSPSLN